MSQSNGWKLVKEALDKRGWQQLPFEYQFSSRFGLKWVERRYVYHYNNIHIIITIKYLFYPLLGHRLTIDLI